MNNIYNGREIYTIRGDMCYDNKIMLNRNVPSSEAQLSTNVNVTIENDNDQNKRPHFLTKLRLRRLRLKYITDTLIFIIVVGLIILIELGYLPNSKLGFICQDPQISYPFRGDTVSTKLLIIISILGPISIITLTERLREKSWKRVYISTIWNYYKECLIGGTLVILLTEVIKVVVGEHRPHFFDSCEPSELKYCKPGSFILDYNCTNTRLSRFSQSDITRSFPSGHAALSTFVGLYSAYIIQQRLQSRFVGRLTKPFLIAVCLSWSLTCSLSRITDRRHHWWDVLAGICLGFFGALYTITLLYNKERSLPKMLVSNVSTTTLLDVKNKDATSVII